MGFPLMGSLGLVSYSLRRFPPFKVCSVEPAYLTRVTCNTVYDTNIFFLFGLDLPGGGFLDLTSVRTLAYSPIR